MPQDQHILEFPPRSWGGFQELGWWRGGNWVTTRRSVLTNSPRAQRGQRRKRVSGKPGEGFRDLTLAHGSVRWPYCGPVVPRVTCEAGLQKPTSGASDRISRRWRPSFATEIYPPADPPVWFQICKSSSETTWKPKCCIFQTKFLTKTHWGRCTGESFNCLNGMMAFDLVLPALSVEWECGHTDENCRCHIQTREVLEYPEHQFPDWNEPTRMC